MAVGMTHADMHYDATVFADPKSFEPERWLRCNEKERKMMERYLVPFSRGGRGCLGIQYVAQEMKGVSRGFC